MPKSYTELYFPVLLQALIAMGLAAGLLTASYLLGKKVRNRFKDMPYESGIVPTGDARHRFSVKFYLVGMLFILFDIEAIFLFPGWWFTAISAGMARCSASSKCWCSWCWSSPDFLHLEEGRSRLGGDRPFRTEVTE
jgi:NADH:ubiquinone oxidoreductase subunit 3 (subunit A)